MKTKFTLLLLLCSMFIMAEDIQLPVPHNHGGMPLMDALQQRKSTRTFSNEPITHQELSNLLWAAWGYNREDKRTAPSSQNKQEMDLYVILENGVYRYDAKRNLLIEIRKGDYRGKAGMQAFVKTAPVNIIMVADRERMAPADEMQQFGTASVNAGYISENIYLYCAAYGLGTVARGSIVREELSPILMLKPAQIIILGQTVGHMTK